MNKITMRNEQLDYIVDRLFTLEQNIQYGIRYGLEDEGYELLEEFRDEIEVLIDEVEKMNRD